MNESFEELALRIAIDLGFIGETATSSNVKFGELLCEYARRLRAALQAQEPVAWRFQQNGKWAYVDENDTVTLPFNGEPLYTSPVTRTAAAQEDSMTKVSPVELGSASAAPLSDGTVNVPREPTRKMLDAWHKASLGVYTHHPSTRKGVHWSDSEAQLVASYRALLSAAPQSANVPEGCTPADAQMLRAANHALAQESHNRAVLLQEWLDTELDAQDEEYEPWLESFTARVKAAISEGEKS